MSLISLLDIISVAVIDPKTFLEIPVSAAEPVTVNPNGINTLSANGLSTFFINGKLTFSNDPRSLRSNPLDCIILGSCVFHHFTLIDGLFAKIFANA